MSNKSKDTDPKEPTPWDKNFYELMLQNEQFRLELHRIQIREKDLAITQAAAAKKEEKLAAANPRNFQVTHSIRLFKTTLELMKDYVYTMTSRGVPMTQAMATELAYRMLTKGVEIKNRPEHVLEIQREKAANKIIGKMLKDKKFLKFVEEYVKSGSPTVKSFERKASASAAEKNKPEKKKGK